MGFLYRLIVVYLCVHLAFPAQVWANEGASAPAKAHPPTGSQAAQPENDPPAAYVPTLKTQVKSDRDRLRVSLHEAAWKMASVIKAQAPALGKIHSTLHYTLLRPYEHCESPFAKLPKTTEEVDAQILKPMQEAVARFFKEHAQEIVNLEHRSKKTSSGAPSIDLLQSTNNEAVCLPAVWQSELYEDEKDEEKNLEDVLAQMEKMKNDGMRLQVAFFISLSKIKDDAPLSDSEMRQWLGWAAGLRKFRSKLAKFYTSKTGEVSEPPPALTVEQKTGKALTQNDATILNKRNGALIIAQEMMSATHLKETLPRFLPCEKIREHAGYSPEIEDVENNRYCFFDGKEEEDADLTERLFLKVQKLNDADEKVAHGALLEAEKELGIQGLFMELATVSTLLPGEELSDRESFEKKWIPDACVQNEEIKPYRNQFYQFARVEEQAWWIQKFNEVTAHIEQDYRTGAGHAPVPDSDEFYEKAQGIAEEWVSKLENRKNQVVAPPPSPDVKVDETEKEKTEQRLASDGTPLPEKLEPKKAKTVVKFSDLVKAFPFEERIRDLNRGELNGNGRDFDTRLGQKVHMWSILVSEDLSTLSKENWQNNRDQILRHMLKDVVKLTLTESLEIYVESFFMADGQSTQEINELWEEEYRSRWQAELDAPAKSPIGVDIDHMVNELLAQILKHERFEDKFDPKGAAEKALDKYVDGITEQVKEAERANIAMELMLTHVFDQKYLPNLLPGGAWNPHNYHHRAAQIEDVTDAPAAFQLGGWYPMFALDANQTEDYLHVKRGLRALVMRHRAKLIDRLTKWALKHRCYRDATLSTQILNLRKAELRKGETLHARAATEAMFLDDSQLTHELRALANDEARQRYENVRTISNLADLVIDKFFEVMEADANLDRGRVSKEKEARYKQLQDWLKSSRAADKFEAERLSFGERIFENYFEPVLDSMNDGNKPAIEKHLQEVAKLLYEREIFFFSESEDLKKSLNPEAGASEKDKEDDKTKMLLELTAKQSVDTLLRRYQVYKDRMDSNSLLSSLTAIRNEAAEKNFFSRSRSTWPEFCRMRPKECRAWFNKVSAFLRDDRIAYFFEKRLENQLQDFTRIFGKDKEKYTGQTFEKTDPRYHQLNFLKTRLFDGWYGASLNDDPDTFKSQAEEIRKIQDELLQNLSDKANRSGNEVALSLLPQILKQYEEKYQLYDRWNQRLDYRLKEIDSAISSGKLEDLEKALMQVKAVFLKELDTFKDANFEFSPVRFREYLISDVTLIFLPEFPAFWREVSERLESALIPHKNPIKEISESTQRITELKDALWSMDFKRAKDAEQAKRINEELTYQEELIKRARLRLSAEVVLNRAIQNYLPTVAEAKAAIAFGAGDSVMDIWSKFFEDQFENTREDGSGKPMDLTPRQVVEDLNRLASEVKGRIEFEPEVAKAYLEDARNYCAVGSIEPHRAAFERNYADVLASQIRIIHMARKEISRVAQEKRDLEWSQQAKMDAPADWVRKNEEPSLIGQLPSLWEITGPEKEKDWKSRIDANQAVITSVKERLRRMWKYKASEEILRDSVTSDAAFEAWFHPAVANYSVDATDNLVLLKNYPSLESFCKKIENDASVLLAELDGHLEEMRRSESEVAKPNEGLVSAYWSFVQGSSDVFHYEGHSFGPIWNGNDEIVWFRHAPAIHFGLSSLFGVDAGAVLTAEKIVLTLRKFLSLPKLGEVEFAKVWEPSYLKATSIPAPQSYDEAGKLAWLTGLSTENQRFIYNHAQNFFRSALRGNHQSTLLAVLESPVGEVKVNLPYGEWYTTFRRHLLLWESLSSEFDLHQVVAEKVEGSSEEDELVADSQNDLFFALSKRIVELFLSHTSYRYNQGRLEIPAQPVDLGGSLLAFEEMAKKNDRRRIHRLVSDIVSLFDEEVGHAEQDFLKSGLMEYRPVLKSQADARSYDPFAKIWVSGTTRKPTGETFVLDYFCEHFVVDTQKEKGGSVYPSIYSWRVHHTSRLLQNRLSYLEDSHKFHLSWQMNGSLGKQASSFLDWYDYLKRDSSTAAKFVELQKENEADRPHLWTLFSSLDGFKASPLFKSFEGLLRVSDGNSLAKQTPETYPYFLALLHWNIREYGAKTLVGPVTDDLPFADVFRAGLLKEMVAVLGLDMKRFEGWEDLLKKRGTPEEWFAIAMSKKNFLVGMNEHRFLSTKVPAHTVVGAGQGSGHYLRPIHVTRLERSQFVPVADPTDKEAYGKWLASLSDEKTTDLLRAHVTSGDTQPLFQRIVSIETQMLGEMDLSHGGKTLKETDKGIEGVATEHRRFADRWGRWGTFKFGEGKTVQDSAATEISKKIESQGHGPLQKDQIQSIAKTREAYVDFRNTVSELNYLFDFEAREKLRTRWDVRLNSISTVHRETEAALRNYLLQMGIGEEKAKELSKIDFGSGDISESHAADYRRRLAAHAIYIASWATNQKLFTGKSESEKNQLKATLTLIDSHYRREAKKIEVKRGLVVVKDNIHQHLTKLCSTSFANIQTDEQFAAAEDLLKETRMIYFNNLHDFLYLESGWVEKGAESDTRRRLLELVDREHWSEGVRHRIGVVITWAIAIGIIAMVVASRNPGMATWGRSMLTQSAMLRGGLLIATAVMGGYFIGDVAIDAYDDIWGSAAQREILTSIRDSQFVGYRSLMKDSTAAKLEEEALSGVVNARTIMPTLKWLWRIWLVAVSFQMLGPGLKAAMGGPMQALQIRMMGARNYYLWQLQKRAAKVGIDAAQASGMRASALKRLIEKREGELIIKKLGALVGSDGNLVVDGRGLRALRKQADREWKMLCEELQLSPANGKPLELYFGEGNAAAQEAEGTWANWAWKKMFGGAEAEGAAFLRSQRLNAADRLTFLREIRAKLHGRHPHLTLDDVTELLAGQDIESMHTPFIMTVLGIPYTNETIQVLEKTAKIVNRGQMARRLLAIQALLKWRTADDGMEVFEQVAREINAEAGKVICTADDLLWAIYHPNARFHDLVVYGRLGTEGAGGSGDIAVISGRRNFSDLQKSAQEFVDILHLGSWKNNREAFKMVAEGHSIQGDQILIRYLLEQEESLLLRGVGDPRVGARRPQASGESAREEWGNPEYRPDGDGPLPDSNPFDNDSSLWSPGSDTTVGLLDDGVEAAGETATATAVAKPRLDFRPKSEDVIVPPGIRDADGILDFFASLPPEKLARAALYKGNDDALAEILGHMKKNLHPWDFSEIEHFGILKSGLSAEDLQSVLKSLMDKGLATPSLIKAYRQTIAYVRAHEMLNGSYSGSGYYQTLVDWYLGCFEVGGDKMSLRLAEEMFQFLYGKDFQLLVENDALVNLRAVSKLLGDWRSGPDATHISIVDKRADKIEALLKRLLDRQPELGPQHEQALARFKSAREFYEGFIRRESHETLLEDIGARSSRNAVWNAGEFNRFMIEAFPEDKTKGFCPDFAPELQSFTENLFMTQFSSRQLWTAMELADTKGFLTEAQKAAYRRVIAYLRAREVMGINWSDSVGNGTYRVYQMLIGKDFNCTLERANRVYNLLFKDAPIYDFASAWEMLNLRGGANRAQIRLRVDKMRRLFLQIHDSEAVEFRGVAQGALNRIHMAERLLIDLWSAEGGIQHWREALFQLVAKGSPVEYASMRVLDQLFAGLETVPGFFERLHAIRISTLRSLARGESLRLDKLTQVEPQHLGRLMDFLDGLQTLSRAHSMLNFARANKVMDASRADRLADVFFKFVQEGRVQFNLGRSEAEEVIAQYVHRVNPSTPIEELEGLLQKQANLEKLVQHLADPKTIKELPAPLRDRLSEAARRLLVEKNEPLLEANVLQRAPHGMPWEILALEEVQGYQKLSQYLFKGENNLFEKAFRSLTSERPNSGELKEFLEWVESAQGKFMRNLQRELNTARLNHDFNKIQDLMGDSGNGPRDQILRELRARKAWADSVGDKRQSMQMERGIERLERGTNQEAAGLSEEAPQAGHYPSTGAAPY